ncbi:MAG TPA: PDDEXK nuclease domain-containing protein [Trichocoleus sp.]|jgi:predicted nuclease of restriction endonuclease-like (RecB) superfamily
MAELFKSGGEYDRFLQDLKERIRSAQVRAALAVNRELVLLYWQIGQEILTRQQQQGWGAKVVNRLAKDLQKEFPEIKGFSARNVQYMRTFAEAYPDQQIMQQLAAQIPWFHNCVLLQKVKDPQERLWYIQKTIEQGWSRNVLVLQIESGLYQRQGSAVTNFEQTLPPAQSDLVSQIVKDPYCFDFLTLGDERSERALERALIDHIKDFLMELGVGFAFLGSQYPIEVSDREYRLDLLFYHVKLHRYVVIDLKMGEFEPEFSGKMNFYVAAVDNLLRSPKDESTIGIILCKSKDKTTVEFALQGVQKPIGVATFQLNRELPESLKDSLPTAEQLEVELNAAIEEKADEL